MRVLVVDTEIITVRIKQPDNGELDRSFRGALLDDVRGRREQRRIMLGFDKHRGGKKKKMRRAR